MVKGIEGMLLTSKDPIRVDAITIGTFTTNLLSQHLIKLGDESVSEATAQFLDKIGYPYEYVSDTERVSNIESATFYLSHPKEAIVCLTNNFPTPVPNSEIVTSNGIRELRISPPYSSFANNNILYPEFMNKLTSAYEELKPIGVTLNPSTHHRYADRVINKVKLYKKAN